MRLETNLIVNHKKLQENLELLSSKLQNNQILFMVKANGYGHGAFEVASTAYQYGVREFGVASLLEAVELRKQIVFHGNPLIYVFSELNLDSEYARSLIVEYKLIPVIARVEDLEIFLSSKELSNTPLVLKYNTGMNRLGMCAEELAKIIELIKKSGRGSIDHLMTHFSCSYYLKKENDRTSKQLVEFESIKKELAAVFAIEKTSVANSGALEQGVGLEYSHVRPGLMLYGPQSTMTPFKKSEKTERLWKSSNISKLVSKPVAVLEAKKGIPIGYGATVLAESGTLLVLPIGYGDGFLTYYSGAEIPVDGHMAKVVGRINMDLTYLLIPNVEKSKISSKIEVEFWNHHPESIEKLAHSLSTIPYQLFCALTPRIPRRSVIN